MTKLRFSTPALICALLFCVFSFSHSATFAQTGTRFLDPTKISVQTLPNGVRSVVQQNPGTDLVSVQVWVRAGSRFEARENNGVTHLIETLATRSARTGPAAKGSTAIEPQQAVEALGGTLGSLSARDSMFYTATVASPFLPQALRALSAATLYPDLSDSKVEEIKEELLGEIASQNDPLIAASDVAYATAFPRHPYRLPAQGTLAGVAALTGTKVRQYHQARFAGSNISVVVAGDVAPDTSHKLVAQFFGGAPKAPAAAAIPQDKPLTSIQRASRRGTLPITVLALAFRSPAVKDVRDVIAADVLLAHWKEGTDATLTRVLRTPRLNRNENSEEAEGEDGEGAEEEGEATPPPAPEGEADDSTTPLALGFEVDYLTQRDSGLFLITVIAPGNRNAVISEVLEEVTKIQTEGLSDAELARAKNLLRHQYVQQGETLSGQAGSLGFYEMIDTYGFAVSYLDAIERVTNDDIKRMATAYLKTDAHVQATIEGIRPPVERPDSGTITAYDFRF